MSDIKYQYQDPFDDYFVFAEEVGITTTVFSRLKRTTISRWSNILACRK